jgi:hypothetical protein
VFANRDCPRYAGLERHRSGGFCESDDMPRPEGDRSRWNLLVAPDRLNEAEKRRRHAFFQLLYFS